MTEYWLLRKQGNRQSLEELINGKMMWRISKKEYKDGRLGEPDNVGSLKEGDKAVIYFVEGSSTGGVFFGKGTYLSKT